MRHIYRVLCAVSVAVVLLLGSGIAARADSVPRMSTDVLNSRLGEAGLTVLDVRTDWDWNQSAEKIAGAERVSPAAVEEWAGRFPKERTLVLYCS
jgi:rhodanese-related sulfurtransferase